MNYLQNLTLLVPSLSYCPQMLNKSTLATQTLRTLLHAKIYKRLLATNLPSNVIEIYNRLFLKFDTLSLELTGTSYRTQSLCYKKSHDHILVKWLSLHVSDLLFLSHFKRNRNMLTNFSKTFQISYVMQLRSAGVFLVHTDKQTNRQTDRQTDRQTGRQADRQTDMTQPIVVFRNF
jgi:hypothetical protein